MPGSMSRLDLVADLKASLHDAANIFTAAGEADYDRLLNAAVLDFAGVAPRTLLGSITLVAGTDIYTAPADLVRYKSDIWTDGKMPQPWEANYPGPQPRVRAVEVDGGWMLVFEPAPSAAAIALFGSEFRFYYWASHSIGDTAATTTLRPAWRQLLLLRAQAEAMREMAMRNVGKPVSLRDGSAGLTRSGVPSALYAELMREFDSRVGR